MKRRSKRMSAAEKDAKARMREAREGEPCVLSRRVHHRCEGPLDFHHVVPQQALKTHFSTFGDAKWERVHDPANVVRICRAGHDAITTHADYLYFHELPARVVDWAEDWGIRWRLEQESPSFARSGRSDLP